jgi:hypothetical protein
VRGAGGDAGGRLATRDAARAASFRERVGA